MAGLPWIRIEVIVPAHPKVQRLEKELGITDALGMLIRLWCWTAAYYPDGEIPDGSESRMVEVVAAELGRNAGGQDPEVSNGDVTPALVTAGLLDRIPGGFRVHDWEEFQGAHIDNAEKVRQQNAERQRRFRASRGNVTKSRVTSRVTVTPRNALEERRGEEKREDDQLLPPPAREATVLALDPRAEGEAARLAATQPDTLADLPATVAVLRLLHAAGKTTAGPARDPRTRRRDEELMAAAGPEVAARRVLAAWNPARPTLGWYSDALAGTEPKRRGMATPSTDFTSPEATTL